MNIYLFSYLRTYLFIYVFTYIYIYRVATLFGRRDVPRRPPTPDAATISYIWRARVNLIYIKYIYTKKVRCMYVFLYMCLPFFQQGMQSAGVNVHLPIRPFLSSLLCFSLLGAANGSSLSPEQFNATDDDKFTPTKHLTPPPHHNSWPAAAHTPILSFS